MPDGPTPTGWLDRVQLPGSDEYVRVRLEQRDGDRLLLRQVDPGDPEPERVPIYPNDRIEVMTTLSHIGIHTTDDPSNSLDLVFGMRIVPVREEGDVVYARTLRHGEEDNGARVHVRPGQTVAFEEGAIKAELDYIDSLESPTASGYVPLAPVLWSWLALSVHWIDPAIVRYVLAAARRLDTANELLMNIKSLEAELNSGDLSAAGFRRAMFLLIGSVETAVVALGRAISMITSAPRQVRNRTRVPRLLADAMPSLTSIRNAYEHIEDRALGNVQGKPDPVALTIFDHMSLLAYDKIVYGAHELDLAEQVPQLLQVARATLLDFTRFPAEHDPSV
jgi:hypothetical protein